MFEAELHSGCAAHEGKEAEYKLMNINGQINRANKIKFLKVGGE